MIHVTRAYYENYENTKYNNNCNKFYLKNKFSISSNRSSRKNEIKEFIKNKNFKKAANKNLKNLKNLSISNSNCKNNITADADENINNSSNNDYICVVSSSNTKSLYSNNIENNFNSDLSLDEDVLKPQAGKLNNNKKVCFKREKILEDLDEQEENAKVHLLRKACEGLLFYRINLTGSSNAKNLLSNINQIHKVLEEIKNRNTFEVIKNK